MVGKSNEFSSKLRFSRGHCRETMFIDFVKVKILPTTGQNFRPGCLCKNIWEAQPDGLRIRSFFRVQTIDYFHEVSSTGFLLTVTRYIPMNYISTLNEVIDELHVILKGQIKCYLGTLDLSIIGHHKMISECDFH